MEDTVSSRGFAGDARADHHDVVIVGSGINGAILAKALGAHHKRVLVLEAGTNEASTTDGYRDAVRAFHSAPVKTLNSAYRRNPNAPYPDVGDLAAGPHGAPGYFVQRGPRPYASDYARVQGGASMYWLGTCLRMPPEDFRTRTLFGQGLDWPIGYDELVPYYARAEREMGVSANAGEQAYGGMWFPEDYAYPMYRIPPSHLDRVMARQLNGKALSLGGQEYTLHVRSMPQARNSVPNPAYDGGRGYRPVGAAGDPEHGLRCVGSASCMPICPSQAKYTALKTLDTADLSHTTVLTRAVVSELLVDPASGRISGVKYQRYQDSGSPEHTTHLVTADIVVLAAHAIENAKVLLASGIESSSGLVGKNLMDHPTLITRALAADPVGAFRGPGVTSGIEVFRTGPARARRAGYRVEIGNWGWAWSSGAPAGHLAPLMDELGLFGRDLRARLARDLPRQFQLQFMLDQMPSKSNRVTIDPAHRDQMGNFRPVIHYDVDDYVRAGMSEARELARWIFDAVGAEDHSEVNSALPTHVRHGAEEFTYFGAGHGAGTHIMGTSKHNSVVDDRQRSWDHPNLFIVGCGSMPTMGAANPTLTMAAMAYRTADEIIRSL
ncbi:GMC family oxidoreductase [Streptomyces sioyaensis]|uniref:GMC family oxidoreductase n=1 Tax=Streptomyces sioyaensis TaxID=67364 RepID=UPI003D73FC67